MKDLLMLLGIEIALVVVLIWALRARVRARRRRAITQAPTKAEAFRRWVEYDGSRDGLQHWLNVWRDKPWEQKPPKEKAEHEKPLQDPVLELCRMAESSFVKYVERNRDQVRQIITKGRTSGVATLMQTTSDGPRTLAQPRFIGGQWVRHSCGDLLMLRRWDPEVQKWDAYGPPPAGSTIPSARIVGENVFDEAFPRKGEWWRIAKPCAHPAASFSPKVPIQFLDDGACCKSCLWEPVNFGRGEDHKPATSKFKVGQWVRHQSGALMRLLSWDDATLTWFVATEENEGQGWTTKAQQDFFEAALPREGEWWVPMIDCECNSGPLGKPQIAKRWADKDSFGHKAALCGCLVPYNFGRGGEAKGS